MNNEAEKPQYFGRDLEAMSFAKNYHDWIVDEFSPYLGKNVAEVGAGTGSFSELLVDRVDRLIAFEPSENMYPELARKFAGNSRVETVNNFFGEECARFENTLDSAVYVNVMEHIEHDAEEFTYIYKALKPGGHALIFVPALPFLYSDLDTSLGHFRRYVKPGLTGIAEKAGLRIVKAHYFDVMGILPWYVTFTLLGKQISGGKVAAYDKYVVPVMRRLEGIIRPPLGKNVLMIARKD
jgi:SAM-dependent methyltransferase